MKKINLKTVNSYGSKLIKFHDNTLMILWPKKDRWGKTYYENDSFSGYFDSITEAKLKISSLLINGYYGEYLQNLAELEN